MKHLKSREIQSKNGEQEGGWHWPLNCKYKDWQRAMHTVQNPDRIMWFESNLVNQTSDGDVNYSVCKIHSGHQRASWESRFMWWYRKLPANRRLTPKAIPTKRLWIVALCCKFISNVKRRQHLIPGIIPGSLSHFVWSEVKKWGTSNPSVGHLVLFYPMEVQKKKSIP